MSRSEIAWRSCIYQPVIDSATDTVLLLAIYRREIHLISDILYRFLLFYAMEEDVAQDGISYLFYFPEYLQKSIRTAGRFLCKIVYKLTLFYTFYVVLRFSAFLTNASIYLLCDSALFGLPN